MKTIIREWLSLRRSRLAQNTAWMVVGQGIGLLLQACYFVVLARLLGAVQYGIYAGAFAFTAMAAQYSSLGAGVVFIRYVSVNRQMFSIYWGNILLVTCGLGTLIAIVLARVAPHFLDPYSASVVLLAAFGNCVFAQITSEAGRVFQAFEQLRKTALLNLLTNFLRLLAAVVMLFHYHQATARQWAIASLAISAVAALVAIGNVTYHSGWPSIRLRLLKDHGAEGFGYCFAGSTTVAYNDIDKVMLSHFGMNAANGIYAMAYRVIDVATIPTASIQSAAISQFFQRGAENLKGAAELSRRLLRRALPISLVFTMGMFLASPVLPLVVGTGFVQSASALRWLCVIPIFRSVQLMTGCALTGAGLQRYRTGAQILAAGLNILLNYRWIPAFGWHGAAVSSLVTDAFIAGMNWGILEVLTNPRGIKLAKLFNKGVTRARFRLYDAALFIWIGRLALTNRFSRRSLLASTGPVVSLTTYGKRLKTVHFTIETIANGTVLPSRLILWIDDLNAYNNFPKTLRRLQLRGLEILLCSNYGPHTKYFPYVDTTDRFDVPMVSADDDMLYQKRWLQRLHESFQAFPNCVSCYLAKEVKLDGDRLAKYREWTLVTSTDPSIRYIAHGVNGTIFPPQFLKVLKKAGTQFIACCPKADDVWLHVHAVRAGFETRQIGRKAKKFAAIPGTQEDGLWIHNNAEGNDRAIAATYTPADVSLFRKCVTDANCPVEQDIEVGSI